jgi:hypothetical protein
VKWSFRFGEWPTVRQIRAAGCARGGIHPWTVARCQRYLQQGRIVHGCQNVVNDSRRKHLCSARGSDVGRRYPPSAHGCPVPGQTWRGCTRGPFCASTMNRIPTSTAFIHHVLVANVNRPKICLPSVFGVGSFWPRYSLTQRQTVSCFFSSISSLHSALVLTCSGGSTAYLFLVGVELFF